METANVAVRMERQTRDDAARLFSGLGISTTQAINMFLKQAVREQRIPFEVAARPAVGHRAESLEEQNRLTASAAAAPLRLGQPPSRGCVLLIGQKYSKYAILSACQKSTTYTRR